VKVVLAAVVWVLVSAACGGGVVGSDPQRSAVAVERATSGGFVFTGENLLPDPVSTKELTGGGGSLVPLDPDELPFVTDLVVEVTVLDVRPSHLTTPDGRFPVIDPSRGPEQIQKVLPETDVVVDVVRVLAIRPAAAVEGWNEEERAVVTLFGGRFVTMLGPEEATALGVLVPVGPEGPGQAESEGPPTGPVEFAIGLGPSEDVAEGDRLVLFLRTEESSSGKSVVRPVHPLGVVDAVVGASRLDGSPIDVEALAVVVAAQPGPSLSAGELDSLKAAGEWPSP